MFVVLISTSVFQLKKIQIFYTKVWVSPPKGVTQCGPHQPHPLGTPLLQRKISHVVLVLFYSVLEFLKNNREGQQCTAKVMMVEEQ